MIPPSLCLRAPLIFFLFIGLFSPFLLGLRLPPLIFSVIPLPPVVRLPSSPSSLPPSLSDVRVCFQATQANYNSKWQNGDHRRCHRIEWNVMAHEKKKPTYASVHPSVCVCVCVCECVCVCVHILYGVHVCRFWCTSNIVWHLPTTVRPSFLSESPSDAVGGGNTEGRGHPALHVRSSASLSAFVRAARDGSWISSSRRCQRFFVFCFFLSLWNISKSCMQLLLDSHDP